MSNVETPPPSPHRGPGAAAPGELSPLSFAGKGPAGGLTSPRACARVTATRDAAIPIPRALRQSARAGPRIDDARRRHDQPPASAGVLSNGTQSQSPPPEGRSYPPFFGDMKNKSPPQAVPAAGFLVQHSRLPAGTLSSRIRRFSLSPRSAERSMPQDSCPIILRGGRFVTATTVLPTSSSGA